MVVNKIENISKELESKFAELNQRKISSLYEYDNSYLVIFSWQKEDGYQTGRNLWRVSKDFAVLWKIEPMSKYYDNNPQIDEGKMPYTAVLVKNGELRAYHFSGFHVGLDGETGEISKIDGQRPW